MAASLLSPGSVLAFAGEQGQADGPKDRQRDHGWDPSPARTRGGHGERRCKAHDETVPLERVENPPLLCDMGSAVGRYAAENSR